jgi:TPR repeat protein
MKKKSGHRRRTKVVRRSRKNLRRTNKRKRLVKGRRRPTRRYSRVQRGGMTEKELKELEEKAEAGDGNAQFKLGVYYYTDNTDNTDNTDKQALDMFNKANGFLFKDTIDKSSENYGEAMYKYAMCQKYIFLLTKKNTNKWNYLRSLRISSINGYTQANYEYAEHLVKRAETNETDGYIIEASHEYGTAIRKYAFAARTGYLDSKKKMEQLAYSEYKKAVDLISKKYFVQAIIKITNAAIGGKEEAIDMLKNIKDGHVEGFSDSDIETAKLVLDNIDKKNQALPSSD